MASIPATFIMSRQAIEFDQLNHPRVYRVGSCGSKLSCVQPVPPSVARIVLRQSRASTSSPVAVRAANAPCCRAAEQVGVGLAEHPVPGGLVERIVTGKVAG